MDRKLDAGAFSDGKVIAESKRWTRIYVDCSDRKDAAKKALRKKYGVTGYPTVVLLSDGGRVLDRITGNTKPAEMLRRLKLNRRKWRQRAWITWKAEREKGKPSMVFFEHVFTPSKMDESLADKEVVAASKNWNCIKIRVDCTKKTVDICKSYGVNLFPTLVFLDEKGNEIRRLSGTPQTAKTIADILKENSK